jgi:predicted nucleic acid-binding protein
MNYGLDTSVVVRVLTDDPPDQAAVAAEWIAKCRADGAPPVLTDLVVAEAYFALQTHYGVSKRDALAALRELLESGDVLASGQALRVLRETPGLAAAKPGFMDRIIHAAIVESGARMLTFEKSAAKLPGVIVLAPGNPPGTA